MFAVSGVETPATLLWRSLRSPLQDFFAAIDTARFSELHEPVEVPGQCAPFHPKARRSSSFIQCSRCEQNRLARSHRDDHQGCGANCRRTNPRLSRPRLQSHRPEGLLRCACSGARGRPPTGLERLRGKGKVEGMTRLHMICTMSAQASRWLSLQRSVL